MAVVYFHGIAKVKHNYLLPVKGEYLMENSEIDRAAFKRMGSKDGCLISGCTGKPVISISITASELPHEGMSKGSMLARKSEKYCASHGEMAFAKVLQSLTFTTR